MNGRDRRYQTLTVADALAEHRSGIGRRLELARRVQAAWRQAVGDDLADRGTPIGLDRGELVIGLRDQVWAQEFSLLQENIITRLTDLLPDLPVQRLRCVYSGGRAPQPVQRARYHEARAGLKSD